MQPVYGGEVSQLFGVSCIDKDMVQLRKFREGIASNKRPIQTKHQNVLIRQLFGAPLLQS